MSLLDCEAKRMSSLVSEIKDAICQEVAPTSYTCLADFSNISRDPLLGIVFNGAEYNFQLSQGWTLTELESIMTMLIPDFSIVRDGDVSLTFTGQNPITLDVCVNDSVFLEDFGSGGQDGSRQQVSPPATTTYLFQPSGAIVDGQYAVTSFSDSGIQIFNNGFGNITADASGDVNGNALIVNADFAVGEFYRRSVTGLTPGVKYLVKFKVVNTQFTDVNAVFPDISVEISEGGSIVAVNNTGVIPYGTYVWQDSPYFEYVASTNVAEFVLINNQTGGFGNDLAIDEIEFSGKNATQVTINCL